MASLAPSLVALRNEVNARWPRRDRTSDGWIGDASHSSRVSDHNPDERGMVHAIDVDVDGINVGELLKATIGDPRVWYVIHNRTIYSRTHGFKPRRYTGSNPHTAHAHVSIRYSSAAETDTRSWFTAPAKRSKGLPTLDVSNVTGQARNGKAGRRIAKVLNGTKLVQDSLNDRLALRGSARLRVDGKFGKRTVDVMRDYQNLVWRLGARTSSKRDGIPAVEDLQRLGRGRFKLRK